MFLSQRRCRALLAFQMKMLQLMCCCLKCYHPVRGAGWGCFSSTLLLLAGCPVSTLKPNESCKAENPIEMLWLPHRPCSPSQVLSACGSPGREVECALVALFVGGWSRAPSMEGLHLSGSKARAQKLPARVSGSSYPHRGGDKLCTASWGVLGP